MKTRSHAIPSRLTALLAALAMMATFVAVTATPAAAATSGFARLTAGAEVLPGNFTYQLEVENSGVTSPAANLFVVTMPAGIGVTVPADATLTAPGGFTGRIQSVGSLQRLIYSGGSLPAGEEIRLDIPTTIAAPTSPTETSGRFDVALSSDQGRSFQTAEAGQSDGGGTLTTIIRFLEIELIDDAPALNDQNELIASPGGVVTPEGARDGSGTEGQSIAVTATVKNYLPVQVSVDIALGAVSGDSDNFPVNESISGEQRITVPGNEGTESAAFDVTLGAAENNGGDAADRPVQFRASAVEVLAGGSAVRNSVLDYEVQIQSRLAVTGSSFAPRAVAPGPQTFTVDVAHNGTPGFTVNSGTISLVGAGSEATLQDQPTFAPESSDTLSFTGQIDGDDGDFPVEFVYAATDDNDFAYVIPFGRLREPSGSLLGGQTDVLVTIDALAPIFERLDINLPDDAEGAQQTAAKDGDTITVSGQIDDPSAELGDVVLRASGINVLSATPTRSPFDRSQFTATFEDVDFPLAEGSFTAQATATDAAGNLGQGTSVAEDYDNIIPLLISARTESTSTSATAALEALVGDAARISVRFAENNLIIGGCNPNEWLIDGQRTVKQVRFTNGQACTAGAAGPDNERILVLSQAYDRDATPSITYTPGPAAGSVKDGAGNFAIEATVTAVTGIVPPIPDLVEVYRNTGDAMTDEQCLEDDGPCEDAYFDEDAYWTRFAGDDTIVCVAGGRAGYSIEVTNGNGTAIPLTRETVQGSPTCIGVPIDNTDGSTFARGVRFANSAGVGPEVKFNIRLDKTPPTIDSVVRSGDSVTVTFQNGTSGQSDKLVEGEDFAIDWLVFEQLASEDLVFYSPDSVSAPSEDAGPGEDPIIDYSTRVLDVDFRGYGDFVGIGYDFQSGDFGNEQYADRAGNLLQEETSPVPPTAQ